MVPEKSELTVKKRFAGVKSSAPSARGERNDKSKMAAQDFPPSRSGGQKSRAGWHNEGCFKYKYKHRCKFKYKYKCKCKYRQKYRIFRRRGQEGKKGAEQASTMRAASVDGEPAEVG